MTWYIRSFFTSLLFAVLVFLGLLAALAPNHLYAQEPDDLSDIDLSGSASTLVTAAQNVSPAALPAGYQLINVARELDLPVDMTFLPNGDILVAEKGSYATPTNPIANIRLVRNGVLQEEPVISLSAEVSGEAGIMGAVLDPNFDSNHYFYVWYAIGPYAPDPRPASVNRLARLTLNLATGTADPASYTIILDDVPSAPSHNGGGLRFLADGTLLISIGDCTLPANAQDKQALCGKLLRIKPEATGYSIPADNPFITTPDVWPEIYAMGLRNPFRLTTNQQGEQAILGDVGGRIWEEVNIVQPGANYGWPIREGFCGNGQVEPCTPGDPIYTDPLAAYMHPNQGAAGGAITGIAWYEGSAFPAEFRGRIFFADYDQGFLGWISPGPAPAWVNILASGIGGIVDIEYYKDALYLLDIAAGRIMMLTYAPSGNQPPVAALSTDKSFGAAPLAVTLSAAGSIDVDDPTLRYAWNFGDGTPIVETTVPWASHTYTADGAHVAELVVIDTRGARSQTARITINVYSGELPTISLSVQGSSRTLFHGGDVIAFAAQRSTTADLRASQPWTWRIELHHNEHTHPEIVDLGVASGTHAIPTDNHGGALTIWYRFSLTMHTQSGQAITVHRDIKPEYTTFRITTMPNLPGLVLADNVRLTTPALLEAIVGTRYELHALGELVMGADVYTFSAWADPTASAPSSASTLVVTALPEEQTYTMHYEVDRPAERAWFSNIAR